MEEKRYFRYLDAGGVPLFTAVCLPEGSGPFPTVIFRNPYVDSAEDLPEETVVEQIAVSKREWTSRGYAVVCQHCRGRGKSGGDCVPYINEREDGLALQAWIREQPFYNGELFLVGASYTASVHFVTAPFAPDVKGAVLEVQDCERYNCNYRNGFYKMSPDGGWYSKMYKRKTIRRKNGATESYHILPFMDFSETVLGERAEDFDEILRHPKREDPFWTTTRYGGAEAHDAIRRANIPILLTTGFYDIYTGGVFTMWNTLDEATRRKCALLVHPYNHGCDPASEPIQFENGRPADAFGDFRVDWIDAVRGKRPFPFAQGQVTYYRLFENRWAVDSFSPGRESMTFPLGTGEQTFRYNPFAPASFRGGLSANVGGNEWQDPPGKRYDVLSFFTPTFERDVFVKGKMRARLCVRSTCEDTCFYVRLMLVKPEGYYGLRDDINQISNFRADYVPGEPVEMTFSFDEHAFRIQKGESIRIDVSSSAYPHYVRHTNQRGLFSLQSTARVADNTVILDASELTIPVELPEEI